MIVSTDKRFIQPVLQYNDDTGLWRLVVDYRYEWADPKTKRPERLTFLAGKDEYDEASVPEWVPPALARSNGPWEGVSYLHDMAYKYLQHGGSFPPGMYQVQNENGEWVEGPRRNRVWADWLLRSAALATKKITPFDAFKYWLSVRLYPENWFKGF